MNHNIVVLHLIFMSCRQRGSPLLSVLRCYDLCGLFQPTADVANSTGAALTAASHCYSLRSTRANHGYQAH